MHTNFLIDTTMLNNSGISAKHIVFDLDGTLVDSAPSIIASIIAAFDEVGIELTRPLTSEIIGPPLSVAMASLLTEASLDKLPRLTAAFMRYYDEYGYLETKIYEGVPEMLNELREMGYSLFIATNKRILPTRKIVDYIGWTELFDGLYSLDYFNPVLQNKMAMLERVIDVLPETFIRRIYVGDRAEDGVAANKNGFRFFGASWGYGASELWEEKYVLVEKPAQLVELI